MSWIHEVRKQSRSVKLRCSNGDACTNSIFTYFTTELVTSGTSVLELHICCKLEASQLEAKLMETILD